MIDVDEENILIESKQYSYLFSFDNINGGILYVDLYNKSNNELVIKNHEITNISTIKNIKNLIDQPTGTIFKKGGVKYMVRNHDKCMWSDEGEKTYYAITTQGNPYDSRTDINELSFKDRTISSLRMAWVNI